jgi:hypothetical protein
MHNEYNPLRDRSYYRMMSDWELLELAKSVKTTELELVLAERLRQAKQDQGNHEEDYDYELGR